ncbi:MAG: crossover junction endodeoxyribonuclease RuvC [Planctomycetes bacterium]|nr:crossover junction endodeoxyribonuclease RuvC [Planctomycetota bacterium]
MVRILGIDPGTLVVGFGCLEIGLDGARSRDGNAPMALRASNVVRSGPANVGPVRLVGAGVLRLGGRTQELPERLWSLAVQFRELLSRFAPAELAIEQAFHGKSVQAALRIGEARGVVLAEAAAARLSVHQFAPARVKRCVAGHGAAAKESVAAMVRQFVRVEEHVLAADVPADATDAVAVAWTRLEERRSPLLASDLDGAR